MIYLPIPEYHFENNIGIIVFKKKVKAVIPKKIINKLSESLALVFNCWFDGNVLPQTQQNLASFLFSVLHC
jgi:hypothetical protein